MRYLTVNLLVYYCSLSSQLKSINCIPAWKNDLTESLIPASTPLRQPSFKDTISNFFLQMLVKMDMYCDNVYVAEKVEKLLELDPFNWWIDEDSLLNPLTNPMCSAFPNAEAPTIEKISDHEFFQTRGIHISKKRGKKGTRLNRFEHLRKEPVWRTILECECDIMSRPDNVARANDVCIEGKIVNLSRGVGGDKSFFVYASNALQSYKVVAHICFDN